MAANHVWMGEEMEDLGLAVGQVFLSAQRRDNAF